MQSKLRIMISGLVVILVLITTGCVSQAKRITEMQPSAIQPDTNVGVIWISPCAGSKACGGSAEASNLAHFSPDGASGLLSYGIVMSAHEDVSDALDLVSADSLIEKMYVDPVVAALEDSGATPKVKMAHYYQGDLPKKGRHSIMFLKNTLKEHHPESLETFTAFGFDYNFDLSAIADELDSSVLVVLHLQQYGVRRSIGPLAIPLGRPYGLSLARAYVWDANTQSVMYNDYGIAEADIGEKWREPDDWTKVHTAANGALELALERAVTPLTSALQ